MGHPQPTWEEKEEEPSGWGGIPIPGSWPRGSREGGEEDGRGWRTLLLREAGLSGARWEGLYARPVYIELRLAVSLPWEKWCMGEVEGGMEVAGQRSRGSLMGKSFGLLRVDEVSPSLLQVDTAAREGARESACLCLCLVFYGGRPFANGSKARL